MKQRVEYIDAMRGFAIILVIIGHLIQTYYCNVYSNAIFRVIYSFHMPLFFFISGCVSKSYLDYSFVSRKECLGGGIYKGHK